MQLDLITDRTVRETYDYILQQISSRHGENSLPALLFKIIVEVLIEENNQRGLDRFMQWQLDRIDKEY